MMSFHNSGDNIEIECIVTNAKGYDNYNYQCGSARIRMHSDRRYVSTKFAIRHPETAQIGVKSHISVCSG